MAGTLFVIFISPIEYTVCVATDSRRISGHAFTGGFILSLQNSGPFICEGGSSEPTEPPSYGPAKWVLIRPRVDNGE